ncbi:MAG: replication initiation protein, partial [Pikeienuella sp.]
SYLTAAIKQDYAAPKDLVQSEEDIAAAEARRMAADVAKAQEAERAGRIAETRRLRAARLTRVRELANARNPTQRDADKRLFASRLATDLDREDFARHGWASALCATEMVAFWEEMSPGAFEDVG